MNDLGSISRATKQKQEAKELPGITADNRIEYWTPQRLLFSEERSNHGNKAETLLNWHRSLNHIRIESYEARSGDGCCYATRPCQSFSESPRDESRKRILESRSRSRLIMNWNRTKRETTDLGSASLIASVIYQRIFLACLFHFVDWSTQM